MLKQVRNTFCPTLNRINDTHISIILENDKLSLYVVAWRRYSDKPSITTPDVPSLTLTMSGIMKLVRQGDMKIHFKYYSSGKLHLVAKYTPNRGANV